MESNEGNNQNTFFDAIQDGDEDICRSLWLGVILQAVLDARGKYGNTVTQSHARIWLEGREGAKSDFSAICNLAGVDFERTRDRCRDLLAQPGDALDFRAMKRDKLTNRTPANRKRYFRRAEKNQRQRQHLRAGVISHAADNDNLPKPDNDNFRQPGSIHHNSSINQPMENTHDQ